MPHTHAPVEKGKQMGASDLPIEAKMSDRVWRGLDHVFNSAQSYLAGLGCNWTEENPLNMCKTPGSIPSTEENKYIIKI